MRLNGFLEKTPIDSFNSVAAYSLSPKAFRKFILCERKWLWQEIKSSQPDHDLMLVEIRSRLMSKKNVAKYYTENELQSKLPTEADFPIDVMANLHCDAAIIINGGGNSYYFAVEYDHSHLTRVKCRERLTNFYSEIEISGVIYVVAKDFQMKVIREIDDEIRPKDRSKMFVTTIKEMFEQNSQIEIINSRKEKLVVE